MRSLKPFSVFGIGILLFLFISISSAHLSSAAEDDLNVSLLPVTQGGLIGDTLTFELRVQNTTDEDIDIVIDTREFGASWVWTTPPAGIYPVPANSTYTFDVIVALSGTVIPIGGVEITVSWDGWSKTVEVTAVWLDFLPEQDPVPEADYSLWSPIMMSFGLIAGLGFIGFNLARGRDPVPGLFMVFTGVTLAWGFGWIDTWIFITAIALVAIASGALWSKLFEKGK